MLNKIALKPVIIISCVLMMLIQAARAQQTNQPVAPVILNPGVSIPGAYPANIKLNFIRTWDANGPITDPNVLMNGGNGASKQTTKYFNGAARVLQTVERQVTPLGKDLVTPYAYDQYGREVNKYLPYASGESNGLFKLDPFNAQYNFLSQKYAGEKVFYSLNQLEASPLNRPLSVMAPGNSWAGNNKGIVNGYNINKDVDDVRIWSITNNPLTYVNEDANTNIPVALSSPYGSGTLTKNVVKDENDNVKVQYSNKDKKMVLEKIQAGAVASDLTGHNEFLCTYYVYDDLSRLRFVIPPAAVNAIKHNWVLTADVVKELCFRYEYDARNRLIAKKVPGSGWVYMVYDMRDRLVFLQDANLRTRSYWQATLYDNLNRNVIKGMLVYGGNRAALQSSVNGASGSTLVENIAIYNYPVPSGSTFITLSKTYYDNYAWTGRAYTTAYNSLLTPGSNANVVTMPSTAYTQTKGAITGTQERVIDDPANLSAGNWITTVNFYDDHLRVIQAYSEGLKGSSVTTNLYNYTGKVLCTYVDHTNPTGTPASVRVKTEMAYDHEGRLKEVWKTINDDPAKKALVSKNEFDELGQLVTKSLGGKKDNNGAYINEPLEVINKDYNPRGWLTGINKNYANGSSTGTATPWFGIELNYDQGFQQIQLNGSVAGAKWRSRGDDAQRAYGYTYDRAGRLLGADFTQFNGSAYAEDPIVKLDVQVGDGQNHTTAYDGNGNLKAMKQWGVKVNNSQIIDDLVYNYYSNSNKLSSVAEQGTGTVNHNLGDFTDKNTNGNDYGYDAHGNMITDLNKRAAGTTGVDLSSGGAIVYNTLNLPRTVTINDDNGVLKGTISFVYDAAGNKLQKTVVQKNTTVLYNDVIYTTDATTITLFLNGFIYESKSYTNGSLSALAYTDKLLFMGHEEGRIRYIPAIGSAAAKFEYDYFIKDNIDNIRMVLTEERQQDIYPAATLEGDLATSTDAAFVEKQFFTINAANVVDKSQATGISDYQNNNGNPPANNNPNSNVTASSQKLYRLTASAVPNGGVTGLGITLKVMSGDNVDVFGKSYYFQNNAAGTNFPIPVDAIVNGLFGAPGAAGIGKGITAADVNAQSALQGLINGYLSHADRNNDGTATTPRAYINWMLLDENFKYVNGSFSRVGSANVVKDHNANISITKNGYLYVYVSNESPVNVFFDNLQVVHNRGPLLEENHYYPFGLTIAGISSKAAGSLANKQKFTAQELDDELDWNVYQFKYRSMDPQTGRFMQVDPLAVKYAFNSTYAYAENKVTAGIDVEGLELLPFNTGWFRFMATEIRSTVPFTTNWYNNYVDVVAVNVPTLFKDELGYPLFSAASVNVGPFGPIATATSGPVYLPGNSLPAPVNKWTWAPNPGLDGVPDDLYKSSTGTDYYVIKGHAGSVPYSGSNAGTTMNSLWGGAQEVHNWVQLYTEDLPNWNAYNSLRDNKFASYTAVELVNMYASKIKAQIGEKYTANFRNDLINFITDGTLPAYNLSNYNTAYFENSMLTLWYGIQLLGKGGYNILPSTIDDFNSYLNSYNAVGGGAYKFDLNVIYKK